MTTTAGERFIVDEQRSPSTTFAKGVFMLIFQDDLVKAAKQIKTFTAFRVYVALIPKLDFVQWRKVNQKGLAAEINADQGSVSKAMADLLDQEILERQGASPHIEWRFSMHWGWRGTPDQYHAELRRRGKPAPPYEGGMRPPIVAEDILRNDNRPPPKERRIRLLATIRSP